MEGARCTSSRSEVKIAVFGITQSVQRGKPFFFPRRYRLALCIGKSLSRVYPDCSTSAVLSQFFVDHSHTFYVEVLQA